MHHPGGRFAVGLVGLIIAAIGLIAFGVYGLAEACWRRV